MKCTLRSITHYPFDIAKESNPMVLAYTCLADSNTAEMLEISSHGYRYILNDKQEEILVLVVRDATIVVSQVDYVLFAPFNLLHQFQERHPRVIVLRKPLQMNTFLLPNFKQAKQIKVYLNSSFHADPALIAILTGNNYIIKTGNYFLNIAWLASFLPKFRLVEGRLQMSACLHQQRGGKVRSYLRCYIQVEDSNGKEYFLFKNGVTKLNIKQMDLHPYNIYKTVRLDKTYKSIYQLEPYATLARRLQPMPTGIVLLQSQKDIGLPQLIQYFCQRTLRINFHSIDCQNIHSTQEFFKQLNWIANLDDAIVLIRNLDWVLELYIAEQILNVQMKNLVSKIQSQFQETQKNTHRQYSLILENQGTSITQDMFQNCNKMSISLDKPIKAYIFKLILTQIDQNYPHKDEIIQICHDKFGWQQFKFFLQKEWNRVKSLDIGDIIKQISKLIKQQQTQNLIEVSWDDVGGLETAKQQIIQTILLPIRHPEIFDEWIKPRTGLLFYGPPGTGKTLLGKCIAKECKMSFISVKGPQLLNMYVGQSEKNVRQVFQRATACKPCIVFMDQLDALIPKRGNNSDSHQVMDRIVAELLIQMDLASANQVFIIGATNRPDLLDPSILRPGRFDKQIYLGITQNKEDRIKILRAQTRHLTLEQNLDWGDLLDQLPKNFTGADFYGLTSRAVMVAAERAIEEYEQGIEHQKITINKQDFLMAAVNVKPSVTEADLRRYEELKKVYS